MKNLTIILTIILSTLLCNTSYAWFNKLSKEDIGCEVLFLGLLAADYSQTRYISKHDNYYERNIVLGKNPSTKKVGYYFLTAGVLHVLTAWILPGEKTIMDTSPRRIFQSVSIGIEAGVVTYNYSIGIGLN
jgi:hypothetical protein